MPTTIDASGRIVIPKSIRTALDLRPGQEVDVVMCEGRVEIEAARSRYGWLTAAG